MKYLPITYSLLKKKKACEDHLKLFEYHIGRIEPIPLNDETIEKYYFVFSMFWAASHLLDSKDLAEFRIVREIALKEYEDTLTSVRLRYNDKQELTLFEKALYRKLADDEYSEAHRIAINQYNKALATEFVRLYKLGLE